MITKTNELTQNETNNTEISTEIVTRKKHPIKKLYKKTKSFLHRSIFIIMNRVMILFLPIDEKRVLFLSDVRENLGGNLEYLFKIIPEDRYKKILSLKADRKVHRNFKEKLRLIYNISVSKYILLDDFTTIITAIKVRKKQEVCQLWHGPGAFKKFGYSRDDKDQKKVKKRNQHRNYTKVPVTGESIRWCYAEGFGTDIKNVQAVGFARTDMFFNKELIEEKRKELYNEYPYLKNKKIILFAPTYRGISLKQSYYDFDQLDIEKIYNELKDKNYVFIFKWHPGLYFNMKKNEITPYNLEEYPNFYYDFSEERDINDLLLISDILITDYSSVIFDYVLLNKPIIYFTYDLQEYENDRGLYFPFKEYVYGKIAKNDTELIDAIKAEDMQQSKRKEFIRKFMNACDGHSTQKTYEWIFENKLNNKDKIIMEEKDCKLNI